MMGEGENCGGPSKTRIVLGDLTNRIGKRGIFGGEKHELKSSDFSDKDVVLKRICVSFPPPPCTEINSLNESLSKIPNENRDPIFSGLGRGLAVSKSLTVVNSDCDGDHSLKGKNIVMGNNSKVHQGNNNNKILDVTGDAAASQSVNPLDVDKDGHLQRMDEIACQNYIDPNSAHLEGGKTVNFVAIEAYGVGNLDALKELGNVEVVNEDKFPSLANSVIKSEVEFMLGSSKLYNEANDVKMFDGESFPAGISRTVSESCNDCLDDGKHYEAGEVNTSIEGIPSDIRDEHDDVDDHNADNFVLSQSGSIDFTVQSESLKEDECAYLSDNACSCSFCTKAAYMWFDLNYQDIKARLSVLKKSQKDASILAERSSRIKFTEKSATESFSRASKLESHLTYQWRSLFQRTADIWEKEGNQLEASLQPMTELREKCKTDLELINAKRVEKR